MHTRKFIAAGIALALAPPAVAAVGDATQLEQIRAEIRQLRETYEARIQALEARLQQAEAAPAKATPATTSSASAFNPAVSLVLSGTYANLSQDPGSYKITGFIPGGEIGPGKRGFSLAESELVVTANIDPYFHGHLTLALSPENTVAVEEATIQTTALGRGLTARAGRFYSGIGYLNEQHPHAWDFVDAPLAYKAFLGRQYGNDGVQARWLAPTDTFVELGAEAGQGNNFPGSERNKNGVGSWALFGHAGGDVGGSQSWRAGLSHLRTSARDRSHSDLNSTGGQVDNAFTGSSRLWLADFVWKWAPDGNPAQRNFKLQGEYFRRTESGDLIYDTAGTANSGRYASTQSGWYAQGVYQFMPRWRVGARFDRLNGGSVDYGLNSANLPAPDYRPSRHSLMLDYAPSEYSRLRLQVARDRSRQDHADSQVFMQYIMSLGAHGAHKY